MEEGKMKKRMLMLFLAGGIIAVGGLFMKAPVTVRAEETVKEDSRYGCVGCTDTKAHFQGGAWALTPGDGQATIKFELCDIYNDGEGNYDQLGFYYSEKKGEDADNMKSYGLYNDGDTSCEITGLTNGKTYYIYAQVFVNNGALGDVRKPHDVIYIGECTPAAAASGASSSGSGSASSSSGSARKETTSHYKSYENKVANKIESAAAGSTIVMEKGTTTISNSVMKELLKKGDVSMKLEFTYKDVEYVIIIPAGAALDNDIPWYGPLYLAQQFGNSAGAANTAAAGKTPAA